MSYVAITANGLRDGEAVFWAKGQWVKTFGEAELFATREPADAALSAARAQSDIVVESYMIDVVIDDGLSVSSAGDGDRVSHGRLLHSVRTLVPTMAVWLLRGQGHAHGPRSTDQRRRNQARSNVSRWSLSGGSSSCAMDTAISSPTSQPDADVSFWSFWVSLSRRSR